MVANKIRWGRGGGSSNQVGVLRVDETVLGSNFFQTVHNNVRAKYINRIWQNYWVKCNFWKENEKIKKKWSIKLFTSMESYSDIHADVTYRCWCANQQRIGYCNESLICCFTFPIAMWRFYFQILRLFRGLLGVWVYIPLRMLDWMFPC